MIFTIRKTSGKKVKLDEAEVKMLWLPNVLIKKGEKHKFTYRNERPHPKEPEAFLFADALFPDTVVQLNDLSDLLALSEKVGEIIVSVHRGRETETGELVEGDIEIYDDYRE